MIAEEDPERKVEPEDIDFGFYFPFEYVTVVCQVLELSDFAYWPEAGGLNNQDANLVADIMTWFRLQRRLRFEYKDSQWQAPGERVIRGGYDAFGAEH